MKKLIATVLIAMIAFAAFAAINVTIDTITQYVGKNVDPTTGSANPGFSIAGADVSEVEGVDDSTFSILGDMNATLSSSRVSALVNLRFRVPSSKYYGSYVDIHGWDITAKLTDWLKLSIGNTAYEIYAESICWEPIFGAGLFEQGKNRIYLDMQFGDLQLITGMSMGQDPEKPWDTLQAAAVYEIPMTMFLSAEYSSVCAEMAGHGGEAKDGGVKTFSFQADYVGTENLDVLAGYTLIRKDGKTAQHRIELFTTYYAEKFAFELYEAFIKRTGDYEAFLNGNRLGVKFTWYATDTFSPFVRFNWLKNYGPLYPQNKCNLAWGECQLESPTDREVIIVEPGVAFMVSDNLSGSIGAVLKFNRYKYATDEQKKTYWAIPLCLTATF